MIRIEGKEHYKWVHGHAPRGHGSWVFEFKDSTDNSSRKICFNGSFSSVCKEAQREAKRISKSRVNRTVSITVMT